MRESLSRCASVDPKPPAERTIKLQEECHAIAAGGRRHDDRRSGARPAQGRALRRRLGQGRRDGRYGLADADLRSGAARPGPAAQGWPGGAAFDARAQGAHAGAGGDGARRQGAAHRRPRCRRRRLRVEPYDLDELLARIRALLRRSAGRAEPVFEHNGVSINPQTREVLVGGNPVSLSAREWAVLEALIARPGIVLSRHQLEEKLYSWKDEVNSNAVEVYIHGLRKKLGSEMIQNVRGLGYMVPKL